MSDLARPKPERRAPKPRKRIPHQRDSRHAQAIRHGDHLWSAALRKRASGRCELVGYFVPCGGPGGKSLLDGHHMFRKKAHPRLRYALDNGLALCRAHHDLAHAKRDAVSAWLTECRPGQHARLMALAVSAPRLDVFAEVERLKEHS